MKLFELVTRKIDKIVLVFALTVLSVSLYLVHALSRDYTQNVIDEAETVPYVKEIVHTFETPYNGVDRMLYRLKQLDITRIEREFDVEGVRWRV